MTPADDKTKQPGNNVLRQAEQKIESQLTPKVRDAYDRVVLAGMKVGLANGPNSIMASLKDSKDVIHDCVSGAINLALLLRRQSRNTMPMEALVPASFTLMLKALDFADRAKLAKIGPAELAQASKMFADMLFPRLGISKQQIMTAVGKARDIASDPAKMAAMKRVAGVAEPGAQT